MGWGSKIWSSASFHKFEKGVTNLLRSLAPTSQKFLVGSQRFGPYFSELPPWILRSSVRSHNVLFFIGFRALSKLLRSLAPTSQKLGPYFSEVVALLLRTFPGVLRSCGATSQNFPLASQKFWPYSSEPFLGSRKFASTFSRGGLRGFLLSEVCPPFSRGGLQSPGPMQGATSNKL